MDDNLIRELAEDLEAYIKHHYDRTLDYPSQVLKYEGEMEVVNRAKKYLGDIE